MKPAVAILISGVTAAVISLITAASVTRASGAAAPPAPDPLRPQLEQLRSEVQALRSQLNALPKESPAPASARPEAAPRAAAPPAAASLPAAPKEGPSLDQIRLVLRQGMTPEAVQKLFEEARKGKSMEALVRSLEAIVEENPQDPSAHCLLARSCIEALMVEPDFIKKGDWARKADAEYVKAIERDPAYWDALYGRALSLSWWPEQLGKLPEAIAGFEKALELQAGSAAQPRYADTYAQLGRLYTKAARTDKAMTVLSEGLRVFPGNDEIKKQLDLLQKR